MGTCSWGPCAFKFLIVHPMLGAQLTEGLCFPGTQAAVSQESGESLRGVLGLE